MGKQVVHTVFNFELAAFVPLVIIVTLNRGCPDRFPKISCKEVL